MTSKLFSQWFLAHIYKTTRCRHHHNRTRTPLLLLFRLPSFSPKCALLLNPFSTSNNPPLRKLSSTNLPPRPKPPPEEEIEESFLKGSGPGGQKINKTNSAVQLKHLPTGLVVKCQATRSRSQNRTIARQLLADKLDDLTRGEGSRASVVGKFKGKKKASSAKKSRRKYRKLEEAKEEGQESKEEDEEEEDGDMGAERPVSEAGNEEHATVDRQGSPPIEKKEK